jgi:DNA-binding response OmpR family regulator
LLAQKSEQYQVTVAANIAEATRMLKQHAYSLVVLDLVLPDGDGRVLLREIRATIAATAPVFVLSGIDRQSIKDECLALGAQRYFNKPFNPEVIATMIDSELSFPGGVGAPAAVSQNHATEPAGSVAGCRVLLAEDDELLAGIIKHRLARDGFDVVHVTSGADAMRSVEKAGWNLVILDVKMPVHDGFEVLARIRSLPESKTVPVIMLTAMGSEKDVVRGYDMGASDYIVKPFSPVELLARVKSLVKS